MSSVEDQIRQAMNAAALEISAGDIPPSPARAQVRQDGGRNASRPARRHLVRWAAPVAAAAAVVAVVATVTTLAAAPADRGPAASAAGQHHSIVSPAQPSYLTGLRSGVIGEFFTATGAQYTTGAMFRGTYISLESQLAARCMASHGFSAPTVTAANAAKGDFDNSAYPDLAVIARTRSFGGQQVWGIPSGSRAFNARMATCLPAAQRHFTAMENAALKVSGPFLTAQAKAIASPQVSATLPGLRACAARHGWSAASGPVNSFSDFGNWVFGHLDGAASAGASAAQLRALNRHWSRVFVQCGTTTVAVLERLQLAQQKTWLASHRAQLQSVLALARTAFADAERQLHGPAAS